MKPIDYLIQFERVTCSLQALGMTSLEAQECARLANGYAGDSLQALRHLEYLLARGTAISDVLTMARKWAPLTPQDVARHIDCKISDKGVGILDALERVACDMQEFSGETWDAKRVALALVGLDAKQRVPEPNRRPDVITGLWGHTERAACDEARQKLAEAIREHTKFGPNAAASMAAEAEELAVKVCATMGRKPSGYLWAMRQVVESTGEMPKGPCDRCGSRRWVPVEGTITGAANALANVPGSRMPCPDCTPIEAPKRPEPKVCPHCQGSGSVLLSVLTGKQKHTAVTGCPLCNGGGFVEGEV